MLTQPQTPLAATLARPTYTEVLGDLAQAFTDQTVLFRLENCALSAPVDLGAHLRRSFLGALSGGASAEAQAGAPCSWDPPCALDVFCREQLRGPRGDGLPKPYVILWHKDGYDLIVGVRVFGIAIDWFMIAAEAMALGLRSILPWGRILPGRTDAPHIAERWIEFGHPAPIPSSQKALQIVFTSQVDVGKTDPFVAPHRMLSRLLRRVDGISRWNGVGLTDEAGRALAQHMAGLEYDTSALVQGTYHSPNAKGQKRVNQTVTGPLVVKGDWTSVWPVLAMGQRCNMGRGAVEGLGAFRLMIRGTEICAKPGSAIQTQ